MIQASKSVDENGATYFAYGPQTAGPWGFGISGEMGAKSMNTLGGFVDFRRGGGSFEIRIGPLYR